MNSPHNSFISGIRQAVVAVAAVVTVSAAGVSAAEAGAIRAGFDANTLARNDDGFVGPVGMGFAANFFGSSYSQLWVNNNGNVTFTGGLSTYVPFGLVGVNTPIIAPYFADVDTRGPGDPVTYGSGTVGGRSAFGVNWVDVGHYSASLPLNSFQLVMIDRSDTGAGNFDFEFNYDSINWEWGSASTGSPARAGFSNGLSGLLNVSYELPGSGITGAFLDTNAVSGLIYNSLNSDVDGRYLFTVRNGIVNTDPVPAPGALALLGLGLFGIGGLRRKMKAAA